MSCSCIWLSWGVFDLIFRSSETKWKYWLAYWDKSSTPRFPCPPETYSNTFYVIYFAVWWLQFAAFAFCIPRRLLLWRDLVQHFPCFHPSYSVAAFLRCCRVGNEPCCEKLLKAVLLSEFCCCVKISVAALTWTCEIKVHKRDILIASFAHQKKKKCCLSFIFNHSF